MSGAGYTRTGRTCAKRRSTNGCNPHANGGLLLRDLLMPDFRDYAVKVPSPGSVQAADTHVLGEFLRDVVRLNPSNEISVSSVPTKRFPTG